MFNAMITFIRALCNSLTPFTKEMWYGYAGCSRFPENLAPLEGSVVCEYNGKHACIPLIIDGDGIGFQWLWMPDEAEETESDTVFSEHHVKNYADVKSILAGHLVTIPNAIIWRGGELRINLNALVDSGTYEII